MSKASMSDSGWGHLARDAQFDGEMVSQKLVALCTHLQPGSSCTILPSLMAGTEHVVKVLELDNGTKWVARLPLPHYMSNTSRRFATDWKTRLESEVATHGYLK